MGQSNGEAGEKVEFEVDAHVYPSGRRGGDYALVGGSGSDLLKVKKTDRFALTQWIGFRVCGCQRTVGLGSSGASSVPTYLPVCFFSQDLMAA
jgi:hypothetical protein